MRLIRRTFIEYANTTWSPTKMKDIIEIENVTKKSNKIFTTTEAYDISRKVKEVASVNIALQNDERRYDRNLQDPNRKV